MNGAAGREASVNISKSEQLSSVVDILYFCVNTGGAMGQPVRHALSWFTGNQCQFPPDLISGLNIPDWSFLLLPHT